MKTLYLTRHAKSSWKHGRIKDLERPLNKRGKKDAPLMGNQLKTMKIIPDLIITSPAARAKLTAFIIAENIDYLQDRIMVEDNIYEATLNKLLSFIHTLHDRHNSVMLIGHNPGLTMLNNYLSNKHIENIPTCGVTGIKFNSSWEKAEAGKGKNLLFIYPKMFYK